MYVLFPLIESSSNLKEICTVFVFLNFERFRKDMFDDGKNIISTISHVIYVIYFQLLNFILKMHVCISL